MHRSKSLFALAALLGTATLAQAGDRSLLTALFGRSERSEQAERIAAQEPLLVPQPESGPLFVPSAAPAPVPQGFTYPAPEAYRGPQTRPIPQGLPAPAGYGYPEPLGYSYPPEPYVHPVHAPAPRVKIEDRDHIHPRAIHRTLMVPDPCNHDCLVPITVCVPPCECEDFCVKKGGCYQKLDFGDYEVEVRVKDDYVEVDYDD